MKSLENRSTDTETGWLDSIRNDMNSQGRKRKTVQNGGDSYEPSTPHKSGK